ncbi:MAG: hypothetical protein FJX60_07825 [Alphaproteobacteria bacterium]|nr:hypothetical protein [Alphaproteobacteria bacterium]
MRIASQQLLSSALRWLDQRQNFVAQNVAQADVPTYRPVDFRKSFADLVRSPLQTRLRLTTSSEMHIEPRPRAGAPEVADVSNDESLNENRVDLEKEMAVLAEVTSQQEMATAVYKKNLQLLRLMVRGSKEGA